MAARCGCTDEGVTIMLPKPPTMRERSSLPHGAAGMSFRQFAAVAAMQGFIAKRGNAGAVQTAREAVEHADALIAALEADDGR
ncbi:hypothetical protein [Rhizobium phage RHph_X2_26]|nr:hypothetical protein [Rhizobium phage RHph_X2_26]